MDASEGFWVVGMLLLVLLPIMVMIVRDDERVRDIDAAHTIYRAALDRLKADPANADLRQQAVTAGRAYVALVGPSDDGTGYDEQALQRDIAVVTTGAHEIAAQQRAVGE